MTPGKLKGKLKGAIALYTTKMKTALMGPSPTVQLYLIDLCDAELLVAISKIIRQRLKAIWYCVEIISTKSISNQAISRFASP
jgi:hypothetical protein